MDVVVKGSDKLKQFTFVAGSLCRKPPSFHRRSSGDFSCAAGFDSGYVNTHFLREGETRILRRFVMLDASRCLHVEIWTHLHEPLAPGSHLFAVKRFRRRVFGPRRES